MTETTEQIMARRMNDKDPSTFDALPEIHKLCLIQSAKDQIAALKEAGMVIVPVTRTPVQIVQGFIDRQLEAGNSAKHQLLCNVRDKIKGDKP